MQIVPMTLFEYTLAFSKERTHLSDRNIIKANTRGRMFSMQEEEDYIGFICTAYEYENEIITYAFTKEQFRNRGVFASLAEHVFHTSDRNVRLQIRVDHPCFKQIDNSLRRINCCDYEGLHYYLLENNDLSVWHQLKNHYHIDECCEWLKRNGYLIYSFSQANGSVIEQIKCSRSSEFQNELNPYIFFETKDVEIMDEMSFAVLEGEKLIAYTLFLKGADNSVVLQQLSTSAETKNSGVIMLALTASMDHFFNCHFSKCAFAIHPQNDRSISFKNMLDGYFNTTEIPIRIYTK